MTPAAPTELRYSHRWVKWWVALICTIVLAPFFAAPFLGEETGVRIAIPICVPATYLLLQLGFNQRRATVTSTGVKFRTRPFPGGPGVFVRREDLSHGYVREVVEYNEGDEIDRHYLAGVQTRSAESYDITGPQPSAETAWEVAYQICGVLNQHPTAAKLEVRGMRAPITASARWLWSVLLWLFLFLSAIAVGGYWELSRNHRSVDPRTGVRPL